MENEFQHSVPQWWMSLSSGIIYLIIGVLVLFYPAPTYSAFSTLFIIGFGVLGGIGVTYALNNRKILKHWEWTLMTGLIDLAITFLLIVNPKITQFVLPLYIGFILMFRSIIGIGFSTYLMHYKVRNWGIVLTLSVLGVLFALLVIWDPPFGTFTLTNYTSFAFLTVGFGQIGVSYELRRHQKEYGS